MEDNSWDLVGTLFRRNEQVNRAGGGKDSFITIAAIIDELWRARNNHKFRGTPVSGERILGIVEARIAEQRGGSTVHDPGIDVLLGIKERLLSWCRPEMGTTKINVDAVFREGRAGRGGEKQSRQNRAMKQNCSLFSGPCRWLVLGT